MLDLSHLNPDQRRAVTTTEGPLLVVAGPGAGKTAVIAARTAYLISEGKAAPGEVLAVTFTNRAGRELRRRLAEALGDQADGVWAGTFHAFALRLLRRWGDRLGFDPMRLTVYADADDRRAALRQAVREMGRVLAGERPDTILRAIGRAKERLHTPGDVAVRDPDMAAIYAAYQRVLHRRNAVDFDDLLVEAVRLLESVPEVLTALQDSYRYLQVDEYQDVNAAQHRLLTLLAARDRNLCVVGDPAQNLFSWRGSDIRYLLDFARDYPEAETVTLSQSYRGTGTLLAVANALAALLRYGEGEERGQRWTANPPGVPVVVKTARDARAEAAFVVAEVGRLVAEGAVRSPADCAVLYRTNVQARELELACLAAGLPYRVRGEGALLGRAEARDMLAYLRVLHNPHDTAALGRVINTPPRRLAMLERCIRDGQELTLATLAAFASGGALSPAARRALDGFLTAMDGLGSLTCGPPAVLVREVAQHTGYRAWLAGRDDADERLASLDQFVALAEASDAMDLAAFLDDLSLAAEPEPGAQGPALTLSTIHAAKGLEWPVVFVTGMEEGLLPHARALGWHEDTGYRHHGTAAVKPADPEALEEELRLCYVAVTRAAERLYLTAARRRAGAGGVQAARPSRFLRALPPSLITRRPASVGAQS